jgi:hypothetical protein
MTVKMLTKRQINFSNFPTNSTDAVKSMSPSRRSCIVSSDELSDLNPPVTLKTFTNYTRSACTLECKAQTMMDVCGCLPYFFPGITIQK